MVPYGTIRYLMVPYGTIWYDMVSDGTIWPCDDFGGRGGGHLFSYPNIGMRTRYENTMTRPLVPKKHTGMGTL